MKTYRIVYYPYGSEDKEWIDVEAETEELATSQFKGGIIISIR